MIKQLILLIQVLGLFFYQLIFTGDLTVTQKIPDSITQGTETVIEITIKKGEVSGFAKIQQEYPDGFTAEPVDTKGATFSFKDNKVKFIWMALPAENEFTISYKIKPNETTIGDFTLGGKFSFILESERKNIEIPIANFSVVSESMVAETRTEEPQVETPIVEEPVIEEPVGNVTINCTRIIESIGDGKYKVTVEIDKKGIQGFAKITEELPSGFTATENDSKDGVFSFKDNEAKILWMATPKGDKYSIVYNLSSDVSTKNGSYTIKGYYSYLENDITRKYNIDGSNFELNIKELATEEPIVEEQPIIETPVKDKPITTTNKVTATPNPENGVTYKIQVGAGHKTVASNYFAIKFNLKDNISTINHEGWIKYLVGSFGEYKSARDKRNAVRNNVKTAFVTAYNTGKRITVQEALMISNQKWYK